MSALMEEYQQQKQQQQLHGLDPVGLFQHLQLV
jgi:hypothetical protein